MQIQQLSAIKAKQQGYTIGTMPKRGYALRTIDDTLFIFREFGSSWDKLIRSMLKAFNDSRHMKVVICNMRIT